MEKITIPARIDSLDTVLEFIEGILTRSGADVKRQYKLQIAAEEIFVNIASYAYPSGEGDATVGAAADAAGFVMEFSDGGMPYNPLSRADPDPRLPADGRKIGGLGIYIVKMIMDEADYRYCGGRNILTLRRHI